MIERSLLAPVLAALFLSVLPSRAAAEWLESKSAHYTVFYQAGYEKDVEFTQKWLDATEQLMKSKYSVMPDGYNMSIYLLPPPADGIDTVQSGQNQCCAATAAGGRTGAIRLLARSAPVWKATNLNTFEAALASETQPYQPQQLFERFRKWLDTIEP